MRLIPITLTIDAVTRDTVTRDTVTRDTVTIGPPDIAAVQRAPVANDVAASRDHWLARAQQRDRGVVYFSILRQEQGKSQLVGQILLHDYDPLQQAALIAYHIFQPARRGQGTGTLALRLLVQYVLTETPIRRLTIITDQNNHASQRVAEKCGFVYTGPAREGLPLICYDWQRDDP